MNQMAVVVWTNEHLNGRYGHSREALSEAFAGAAAIAANLQTNDATHMVMPLSGTEDICGQVRRRFGPCICAEIDNLRTLGDTNE